MSSASSPRSQRDALGKAEAEAGRMIANHRTRQPTLAPTQPARRTMSSTCLKGAKKDLRLHDPGYRLLAVQRPLQPSARLYEPLPVLPDILPVDVSATPSSPILAERKAPSGLIRPMTPLLLLI